MGRIYNWIRSAPRHKWATAAVVTIATLLARDTGIQEVIGSAVSGARQAVSGGRGGGKGRIGVDSGFLRYAAMIQSREQLERARREYNENESRLKGDALLEAQDRLRRRRPATARPSSPFSPNWSGSATRLGCPSPTRPPRPSPRSTTTRRINVVNRINLEAKA